MGIVWQREQKFLHCTNTVLNFCSVLIFTNFTGYCTDNSCSQILVCKALLWLTTDLLALMTSLSPINHWVIVIVYYATSVKLAMLHIIYSIPNMYINVTWHPRLYAPFSICKQLVSNSFQFTTWLRMLRLMQSIMNIIIGLISAPWFHVYRVYNTCW